MAFLSPSGGLDCRSDLGWLRERGRAHTRALAPLVLTCSSYLLRVPGVLTVLCLAKRGLDVSSVFREPAMTAWEQALLGNSQTGV